MNIDELITAFREESDDTIAADYTWSSSFILTLMNDAVDQACFRKGLLFDKSTASVCNVAITSAADTYVINTAIIHIKKAYLVSGGVYTYLNISDRDGLDWSFPTWRESIGTPVYLITDDKSIQLVPPPTENFTLYLEVSRVPLTAEKMIATVAPATPSVPVIALVHHPFLYHWPLHVAYNKRNMQKYDPARSAYHLHEFEKYFGKRPDANRNRPQQTNRLHTNKVWA
jgi:hypothetical protein